MNANGPPTGAYTGCVRKHLQTDSHGKSAAHECTLSQPNRSVAMALGDKQLGPVSLDLS